jgi:hypothetical protein
MIVKEKLIYDNPVLEITNFYESDVISTSAPTWDDENVDSGGWT